LILLPKNRIKIKISGGEYYIVTEDAPEYVQQIGAEVDDKIERLMRENQRLSLINAAVFVALEYADYFQKSEQSAEHLRSQIKGYLEDSQKYKLEAEFIKREVELLRTENNELREKTDSHSS
jgi:cell division protein ZapA